MNVETRVRAGLPTFVVLILVMLGLGLMGWWVAAQNQSVGNAAAMENGATTGVRSGVVRVMTANIRMAEPEDGVNAWPNRREFMVKTMLKSGADLIGCQEVTPAQGAYLTKELGKWYEHFPRPGVNGSETQGGRLMEVVNDTFASLNTLFYRSDRFEIVEGDAGLVLPDQLQKEATENTFYTLAVLKEKGEKHEAGSKKQEFIVVDTHLRHREAFAVKCALAIRQKIAAALVKRPGAKVVVVGDMNHDRTSQIYASLVGTQASVDGLGMLTDSFDYTKKRESWGTYHAFTGKGKADSPTDLIFAGGGLAATGAEIVRDHDENAHYPSDHFFVVTDLSVK